jgi:hypothetical protein
MKFHASRIVDVTVFLLSHSKHCVIVQKSVSIVTLANNHEEKLVFLLFLCRFLTEQRERFR